MAAKTPPRPELNRFVYLHDSYKIDRRINHLPHETFFDLDATFSSGLLDLVNDISNNSKDSSLSAYDKQVKTIEVLSKNINTEKYVELNLEIGAPLPSFSIADLQIAPSLFILGNAAISFSISNYNSAIDPNAQTFLKIDQKFGSSFKVRQDSKRLVYFSLYKLRRSDMGASVTSTQMSQDGKIFDPSKLTQFTERWSLDLGIQQQLSKRSTISGEIEELTVKETKGVPGQEYPNFPLFNILYEIKMKSESFNYTPLAGIHARTKYEITRGYYAGIKVSSIDDVPVEFIGKIDAFFLNLSTALKFRHFEFIYTLKTPYRNPQDEMWVPATHRLTLNVPF